MNKTTVIYHRSDYDGIFCREIARKFIPDAELIGWEYGDETPNVPQDAKLYILDLSVPGLMEHPNLIWIDHHKTAIDKYPATIPGYRLDGVAACRLAWQWFTNGEPKHPSLQAERLPCGLDFKNRAVDEPLAVRLAGEYDIWDRRDPRAEILQYGLRTMKLDGRWAELLSIPTPTVDEVEALIGVGHSHDMLEPDGTALPPILWALLDNGKVAQAYSQHIDESLMKSRGFEMTWEGLRFLCVNTGRFNSLTFKSAVKPEHDALLGFAWNGKKWTVSLYHVDHRTDLDLSTIAVKYGGGGHRGACGFTCDKLPWI